MKPVLSSRMALVAMSFAAVSVAGCGKSDDGTADAPKGAAQRSDVQEVPAGAATGQQSMSSVKRPSFDNTK